MMQINGRIPSNMAVDEITVEIGAAKTFVHSLSAVPDGFIMLPKSQPTGTGAANPYMIYGAKLSGGGYGDCPYKLIRNYSTTGGNWDYTGSNSGWDADNQYVYMAFNNAQPFSVGEWYLITFKYD